MAAASSETSPDFDATLRALIDEAQQSSVEAAVDSWLPNLDENFIPKLGERLNEPGEGDDLGQLSALMESLESRSLEGFERAKEQLNALLESGEINKMDAALCRLVKQKDVDAGFFYVLFKNMERARADGDDKLERLLVHLHTRTQEELEKQADPALALLHKLTRTDDAGIRGRVLRHHMVPQTSVKLPDGTEMPLSPPAPAQVSPAALATAIEGAINSVMNMAVDPDVLRATAEEVRTVAKEARAVVVEAYPQEVVDEFSEALTPVFSRALPPKPMSEPSLVEPSAEA